MHFVQDNKQQSLRVGAAAEGRRMQWKPMVFALTALFCAGCATTDTPAGEREERVYRTGSNLPVKDKSSNATVIDGESARQSMRPGGVTPGLGRSN